MVSKKYNLENKKDREELITYALNISDGKMLAIKDEMFKKGYREHVDDLDVKLYYWMGENAFDAYIHGQFRYDMMEADFLGITHEHPYFKTLVQENKQSIQGRLCNLLPELLVYGKKVRVDVEVIPDSQIKNSIRAKWTQPHMWKIKKSLEDKLNGK